MESLKHEYRQFLHENFKGLRPSKPLFYNWDLGIRFNLQTGSVSNSTRQILDGEGNLIPQIGDTETDEYFIQVTNRSTTIFKTVFDNSDKVILVLMDYKHKRRKIRQSNFVFRQIADLKKNEIAYTREHRLYDPSDKLDIRNIALVKITPDKINFKNILMAICHKDFPPRHPRLDNNGFFSDKEIYFINLDKKMILHMYDDRGLDIIAVEKESLRTIYEKHNDWILEYGRNKVDNQFKS